jgi:hypothetical protein
MAVSFPPMVDAQTQFLVAVVKTPKPESRPLAHERVIIESAGLGPYETTDSGKFQFPLAKNLSVGHEATFRVESTQNKKWVILYPCDLQNGRKDSLPAVGGNPLSIIVAPWGSDQLKKFYSPGCLAEEHASQFRPRPGSGGRRASLLRNEGPPLSAGQGAPKQLGRSQPPENAHRFRVIQAAYRVHTSDGPSGSASRGSADPVEQRLDEFLARKATELGVTVEDLAKVVDAWVKSVEDPYERGLAALYEGRYAEASRYISDSITSSTGDVLKRYVPLARRV